VKKDATEAELASIVVKARLTSLLPEQNVKLDCDSWVRCFR
jgi:hypothetical protein